MATPSASLETTSYAGQAWQYSRVGVPLEKDIAVRKDTSLPQASTLAKDQLIVEVISASLNPADYKYPEAGALANMTISRPATPGLDLCGRVVATHPQGNDSFKVGDVVFGGFASTAVNRTGALRKYTVIPASNVAKLPPGVEPDNAAAVGTAASSAWVSLRPGQLPPGSMVFINGGSGGVGTWTIQFARTMGYHVVTSCSGRNAQLCRDLGADEIIDYRTANVVSELQKRGPVFDLVVDNVGADSALYHARKSILKTGGAITQVGVGSEISVGGLTSIVRNMMFPKVLGGPGFEFMRMTNTTEVMGHIGELMAEGKVRAVIDRAFAWEEVPQAYAYLKEGHAVGKVVVRIGK